MADRNLAIAPLDTGGWDLMVRQADILIKSRFLPASIDTPEKAITIMMTGAELGVPRMQALRQIYVVGGKPTCMAELMAAMIYRDQGDDALIPVKSTPEVATYRFKRRSWPAHQEFSFTIQQAETAGLLGGKNSHNWTKYPDAMLRARCISAIARMAFPDTIGGMYTPEELDAEVKVNPDGTMEITEHAEPVSPPGDGRPSPQRKPEPPAKGQPVIEVTARPSTPSQEPTEPKATEDAADEHQTITDLQHRQLIELRNDLGVQPEDFIKYVSDTYGKVRLTDLTRAEAKRFIRSLERSLERKLAKKRQQQSAEPKTPEDAADEHLGDF